MGLLHDTRGAAYVEFLVSFMPLATAFVSFTQLSNIHTANLMVDQAAMRAARVASVVIPDDPKYYGGGSPGFVSEQRLKKIEEAVAEQTDTMKGPKPKVTLDRQSYKPGEMIEVTVEYEYECDVPIGDVVACGADRKKTLKAQASLPNQGAEFIYDSGDGT